MSSRKVEREIVQMEFDARKFSKGVQTSMDDLNSFKKSFDMTRAQHSLAELDKASEGIDFSGMQQGLTNVTAGFSIMGTVGFTVVNRLTNAIIDMGKKLVDTIVVDPVRSGLEEYETQLNAVQTILANTQKSGTTLDDVNVALDELNEYADLTIYNFTEMTSAIGKFTTAGVSLDDSVLAIKGLSNVAALSGSNAQEAARAQYQLSQALSSGSIRLQDWMSLETANIAGQAFKDSILETARAHGVNVDAMIEKNGNFRLSLQEQWLSTEIMLETLSKFTGELSDEQLLAMGYSEEQVVEIQKLAETAVDSATKIKTVTQLVDVLKEALGSGWAQTWRTIFGDFEQAKELWGGVAEVLTGLIEEDSNARNTLLKNWAWFGGRDILIQGFFDLLKAGTNIIAAFKDAVRDIFEPLSAWDLVHLTETFGDFALKIRMGTNDLDTFKRIVSGLAAILDIALMVVEALLGPIFDLVKMAGEGSGGFIEWIATIADSIVAFRKMARETDFFKNIVANVLAYFEDLIDRTEAVVDSFLELEVVQDIAGWFSDLEKSDFVRLWTNLLNVLRLIIAPFYLLGLAVKDLYEEFIQLEVVQKIIKYFDELTWKDIKEGFHGMADGVRDFFDSIRNSEILGKFIELVKTFDGRRLTTFLDDGKEGFSWFGDAADVLREKLGGLNIDTEGFGETLRSVGQTIKDGIVEGLDYLIKNAGTIDYSALFDVINTGLLAGLVMSIRKIASGGFLTDAIDDSDIGDTLIGSLEKLEGTIGSFQNNVRADTLQKIAIAIGIFAGAIFLLTLIDSTKLETVTLTIAAMLGILFGSSAVMKTINTRDMIKTSVAIVGLSVALAIASIALRSIAGLDGDQIKASLAAMAVGLVGMVTAVNTIQAGKGTAKNIAMLFALSATLHILASAISKFGEMDPDTLAQGLLGVTAALTVLVGALVILQKAGGKGLLTTSVGLIVMSGALLVLAVAIERFASIDPEDMSAGLQSIGIALAGFAVYSRLVNPKGMIAASIGLTIMAAALVILAEVIKTVGGMDQEELIQGLAGIGAALLILVVAANLMAGAMAGAIAALIMSVAIVALAGALKLLGSMSIEELLIALAAVAGLFIILGLAGLVLAPVVPVLLALGVAMLLLGVAAGLLGLGIFLAATGLVALAASAAAIAAGIGVVGLALIEILPRLGIAIAEALTGFLVTIAEKTPELIEAFKTFILGMITAITELIPDIVIAILAMITALLQAIAEALPDIIQAGYDILLAFIEGIADNIADVVEAGLNVLTEFINGIAEGLPDLVDSAFNLILTFLDSIADAVEEYTPQIIAAGLRIGEALIDGVAEAIGAGGGGIKSAIWNLVQTALDALNLGFLIDSPSKATYRIAEYAVQGIILAFTDGIKDIRKTMNSLTTAVKDELTPLQYALSDGIDAEWEFNPVIRPVLDLDEVSRGRDTLGNLFKDIRVGAKQEEPASDVDPASGGSTKEGVTFVQNNYSPKALDRETIYRQTRTQVARLATRAFEQ